MITHPQAEAFASKVELSKVVTRDPVAYMLYGVSNFSADPAKVFQALNASLTPVTGLPYRRDDPAVEAACEVIDSRLSNL